DRAGLSRRTADAGIVGKVAAASAISGRISSVNYHEQFGQFLSGKDPLLALAPMQDVTDLPFLKLMSAYGGADVYYTEYFRVHATSSLEKYILQSITENPTGQP